MFGNNLDFMVKRFIFFILLCTSGRIVSAQTLEQDANLKAEFIYNFTRYIDWDIVDEGNDFVIGVIGSSAVTGPLADIAKTSTVKNKKIIIRQFDSPEEISYCNILFISANSSFSLSSILSKVSKGMLPISEEAGFAEQGSAFNFVIVNDKLRFEANMKSIAASGLKISSQLLKLAIRVD